MGKPREQQHPTRKTGRAAIFDFDFDGVRFNWWRPICLYHGPRIGPPSWHWPATHLGKPSAGQVDLPGPTHPALNAASQFWICKTISSAAIVAAPASETSTPPQNPP